MATHFEDTLRRDIERIRAKVAEMCALAEQALLKCLRSLREKNRTLAYSVILGDQRINDLDKQVDRLCLEFLVRQQPVAGPLRMVYATIRINLELERVGDYAESIARQVLKLSSMDLALPTEGFEELARHSIPMLRDAITAFVREDAELARKTMAVEEVVDAMKSRLNRDLLRMNQDGKLPFEALNSLMMVARHFERVSDQAKNICAEVLYMCTGEFERHKGTEVTRVLFVDKRNACRSQMAEAIGNSLGRPEFVFSSAGLDPDSVIDPGTVDFLRRQGTEVSRQATKAVRQIPHLDLYQFIIALTPEAKRVFPSGPTKTICMDWSVHDPSKTQGDTAVIEAAYEATYTFLREHINDLVEAVLGEQLLHPAESRSIPSQS